MIPRASHLRILAREAQDLGLHFAMRALSTERCSNLGARLGLAAGRNRHPVAAARARAVLARLRPDITDPAALAAVETTLWRNVGRSYAEFSVLRRIIREDRVTLSDPALLRTAGADLRPLILCFLHLGNWEVLGDQVAQWWPNRITGVVMPPANRAHALIAQRRRRHLPAELVTMDRNVWRVAAARLRQPGGMLWLAADEAHQGRVGAPLFGREPVIDSNLGKMVRLASVTGARILPIYAERQPGVRFVVHALPPIGITAQRGDPASVVAEIVRIDAILDPIVRRLADQWYMAIEFGDEERQSERSELVK